MTLNREQTRNEYTLALHDDGAGGLVDETTLESRIADDMAQLGTVYTSEASIPSTATVRIAGTFADPYAAAEYLEVGGLVATDGSNNYIPIGFVYLYEYFDDDLYMTVYRVYIDEDT